jgi:integrase
MRVQNPDILRTAGKRARYYIRPYVDCIDPQTGKLTSKQQRIYLGSADMGKRDAIHAKNRIMDTINRRQYVVQAQMRFVDFLDHYLKEYVAKPENLAASTQAKYDSLIKNHIRPAFEHLTMAEVDTRRIDAMLSEKAKAGLSHSTRTDIRNILCGIFTQAERWGIWKERNPAKYVTLGRPRPVRLKRKLTEQQTQDLILALPEDVQLLVVASLTGTLRISEVLGLQWKHVDWHTSQMRIEQRYYRGDLDIVKTSRAKRTVPLSDWLKARLQERQSDAEDFVFGVKTKYGISRDDRDILQHFVRPAAKELGIYYNGFGWHAFRREAITNLQQWLEPSQVMRMAGHAKMDMTLHYTLDDSARQAKASQAIENLATARVQ